VGEDRVGRINGEGVVTSLNTRYSSFPLFPFIRFIWQ